MRVAIELAWSIGVALVVGLDPRQHEQSPPTSVPRVTKKRLASLAMALV